MSKTDPSRPDRSRQHGAGKFLSPPQLVKVLQRARRRSWLELTWDFPRERDCLAGFIAFEAAEVLAGCKPANLIRISNRPQVCGRNLYRLWQEFSAELLERSPLEVCVCRENEDELLLLIYQPELLERRLGGRTAGAFLKRCGYPSRGLEKVLDELRGRFEGCAIPHEIGVFLGYPLKDVTAFLGWSEAPFTCQRGWKIFGKAHRSLALADRHLASRERMSARLKGAASPAHLLQSC